MCGICGVFGKADVKTAKKMLPLLAHRGPDDEYVVHGRDFCLGARRLSIIDIEGGRQPLSNETGDVWVAQNGEIYNFPFLRDQLIAKGHHFKSRTDTEVIVHVYEDQGREFYRSLNGMFAISLWDDAKKQGFLVRDRAGKKPLYYLVKDGVLYFASEIKALLLVPGFERKINIEALHHFLSYKHVPCPLSIFQGIYALPPAHSLTFCPGYGLKIERYWKVHFNSDDRTENLTEEEHIEELLRVLKQAVRRRLISDVPIGFFLSGGLDSGLSAALAAEMAGSQIKTFTLTYPESRASAGKNLDRESALKISQMYDTEHHEETIDFPDFPKEFPAIIDAFDEPFSGVASTYFLARAIARHVKVALSGDGADELFGSYLSHRLAYPLHNYVRSRETGETADNDLLVPYQDDTNYLESLAEKEDWRWRYKLLVFSDEEKASLYSPEIAEVTRVYSTLRHLRQYFDALKTTDPLNRILEAEFYSIFPDQVLAFVDRLSMAHSLEIRTAYLDPEFIELAARIPGRLKIKNGETKYILKQAGKRYLPPEIANRKKEGFIMPVTEWLYNDLEEYMRETLGPSPLKKHGLFNAAYVTRLIDDFYDKEYDYMQGNKLLSLLAFQVWYNIRMNGQAQR
ncbi:MAG: asparagine synthase (glutamine-hydrolyzing) [Dehalococcoidales bacterium]|nr:asparagine synthase (glutamine-hydrolyzing) [Dehalococcoidales bacterium]